MNEDELLDQMAQYLNNDTQYLREQNLSEEELKQVAANKAGLHYNGQWNEQEQEIIDAISTTYQHCFIISARGHWWYS